MAKGNRQSAGSNRYKSNGKGFLSLAILAVIAVFIVSGGYLFFKNKTYSDTNMVSSPSKTAGFVPKSENQMKPPDVFNSISSSHKSDAAGDPARITTGNETLYKHNECYTADVDPQQAEKKTGSALLSIVVDDMGTSLNEANTLASIGVPITFAIIPGLRSDQDVASFAAGHGIEFLIHLPMQPKEYPQRRIEQNGLLIEHTDDEIITRVRGYLARLPGASGANNHMGSEFTEHHSKMKVVLNVLKENRLFFLDSVTTPATTGIKVARGLGIQCLKRDIFLDNEQNEIYIKGQLDKALIRARKNGRAVAICHPHPVTIATLLKYLPQIQKNGDITLVTASRLLK